MNGVAGPKSCPKCSSEMELGSSCTESSFGGRLLWFKGSLSYDRRIRLFPPRLEPITETYRIAMYRCPECGFLEAFARDRG